MPERSARQPWTLWGLPIHAAAGVGAASLIHVAHGSALEITVAFITPCVTYTLAILSCFLATRCFVQAPEAAPDISEQRIEVEVKSLACVRIHTLYGQAFARRPITTAAHPKAIKPTAKGRGARRHPNSRAGARVPRQRPARAHASRASRARHG